MSECSSSFDFFDEQADRAWRFTAALEKSQARRFTAALEKFQLKFATALKRARRRILAQKSAKQADQMAADESKRLAKLPKPFGNLAPSGWEGFVAGLTKTGKAMFNNVSERVRK